MCSGPHVSEIFSKTAVAAVWLLQNIAPADVCDFELARLAGALLGSAEALGAAENTTPADVSDFQYTLGASGPWDMAARPRLAPLGRSTWPLELARTGSGPPERSNEQRRLVGTTLVFIQGKRFFGKSLLRIEGLGSTVGSWQQL